MAQANMLRGNQGKLLAKIEAAYGTDPTPTVGANAVLVSGPPKIVPVINMIPRSLFKHTLASAGEFAGSAWYKYTHKFRAICAPDPSSNPLPEPDYSPFLQASGLLLASTGSPLDTHTYTLSSKTAQSSLTQYFYIPQDAPTNEDLFQTNGCVNNLKFTCSEDAGAFFEFDGMGRYVEPVSLTASGDPTYIDLNDSMPGKNATFTIHGVAFNVTNLEIDLGMTVEPIPDIGGAATHGRAGFYVTRGLGSSIKGKLTAVLTPESVHNRWAFVTAETLGAFSLALLSPGGTQLTIVAPAFQFTNPDFDIEKAKVIVDQPFVMRDSADTGDDAISFVFTRP